MSAPIMSYKLNANNAKSIGASLSIEEKGAYYGIFTRAELVESRKGTQGIEFDFKSNEGATAKFLTIWTVNGEGKELGGRKVIDGILTSMGIREINAAKANIKKWNSETRAEETVQAVVFPELMGPQIGLVLCREEYASDDGSRKWKNVIVCPFEAATNRLPVERLDNKQPELLDKMVRLLKDRPLRAAGPAPTRTAGATAGGSGFDDMDDDIPF